MKRTLRQIIDCLSGTEAYVSPRPTPLTEYLHGKNLLLQTIASTQEGWDTSVIHGVCSDSRDAEPGKIFACFKGEHTDGHDHAVSAVTNGATAILADRDPFADLRQSGQTFPAVLLVASPLEALWCLALRQRANTTAKVIGITGTAGKTTLKEVLASVLSCQGKTEKNLKNLNSQIGLAISMINADEQADYWVMEAGISQPHDMEELGSLLQPDISIILNAGDGHTAGLGEKGVHYHKASLGFYTTPEGFVFVNTDYPKLMVAAGTFKKHFLEHGIKMVTFGSGAPAQCRAAYQGLGDRNLGRFLVRLPQGDDVTYETPFMGDYGAENTAAIVSVATLLKLTPETIQKGFSSAALPGQRFTRLEVGAVTLIDDSYNSNPLSARCMVGAAAGIAHAQERKLVLVMGEMRELGAESANLHNELGRHMAAAMPHLVIWKNGSAEHIEAGLRDAGYTGPFCHANTPEEFTKSIAALPLQDLVVLFKASRSIKLETFVEAFKLTLQGAASAI